MRVADLRVVGPDLRPVPGVVEEPPGQVPERVAGADGVGVGRGDRPPPGLPRLARRPPAARPTRPPRRRPRRGRRRGAGGTARLRGRGGRQDQRGDGCQDGQRELAVHGPLLAGTSSGAGSPPRPESCVSRASARCAAGVPGKSARRRERRRCSASEAPRLRLAGGRPLERVALGVARRVLLHHAAGQGAGRFLAAGGAVGGRGLDQRVVGGGVLRVAADEVLQGVGAEEARPGPAPPAAPARPRPPAACGRGGPARRAAPRSGSWMATAVGTGGAERAARGAGRGGARGRAALRRGSAGGDIRTTARSGGIIGSAGSAAGARAAATASAAGASGAGAAAGSRRPGHRAPAGRRRRERLSTRAESASFSLRSARSSAPQRVLLRAHAAPHRHSRRRRAELPRPLARVVSRPRKF